MALPTSKTGKITKQDFFDHASAINIIAEGLGTINNPITDANAARPARLKFVVWDTSTVPLNWQTGDFNLQNPA